MSLETRDPQVGEPGRGSRPRWPRRLLIGVGVAVGLLALIAGGLYGYARYRFDQIDTVHVPSLGAGRSGSSGGSSGPVNILVVGSDSRSVAGNDAKAFGTAQQVVGQRADVIKIVHLVPGASKASVLSIPRDLLVPIAGTDHKARINTAFEAGPDQLVRTIQQQFDIPIDHYVLVTFEGFEAVVNALGGINLSFPTPARDAETGLHITRTGCQHLNGREALAVARSRHYSYYRNGSWHYDPTSDFGRIKRQSVFLRAVIKRAHGIGLFHPLKADAVLSSVAKSLTIDDTWSLGDVISLGRHYRSFDSSRLVEYVLPTQIANNYGSLGDVLLPQPGADKATVKKFLGTSSATRSPAPSAAPSSGRSAQPSAQPSSQPPARSAPAPFNPSVCGS